MDTNKFTLDQAVGLYSKFSELEARASRVILDVNMLYLRGKLDKMKELLKGFSVFASEVSKAMISIAQMTGRPVAFVAGKLAVTPETTFEVVCTPDPHV